MDRLTKEQRKKCMSHIRSKDSKIEVNLRRALWNRGYRYRKNYKKLPGKPDIALTKYKIAIFCDSEFFHGKDWDTGLKEQILRGSNSDFWIKKINRNMERDQEVNEMLSSMGWKVVRFWGKEIEKDIDKCIGLVEDMVSEMSKISIED